MIAVRVVERFKRFVQRLAAYGEDLEAARDGLRQEFGDTHYYYCRFGPPGDLWDISARGGGDR